MPLPPSQFKTLRALLDSIREALKTLADAIRESSRETITSISNQTKAQKEGQDEVARQVSLVPIPKHERDATEAQQERRHGEHQGLQRLLVLTSAATALFTFLAFGAAAYYAHEAHQQSVTLEKTYCEIQKQTRASQDATVAAQNALTQSENHFRLDERPYLAQTINGPGGPTWVQNTNDNTEGQIAWNWHITNYGKTPAQDVSFTQEMRLAGQNWKLNFGEKGPDFGPPQLQGQDTFDTVLSDTIPRSEFDKLLQITGGISIRIKIHYRGLDGTSYETGLCLGRMTTGAIIYCKSDNYIQ